MAPKREQTPDDWDDTDLVKVWEDCLAEYKKYHSIAANGGSIEAIKGLASAKDDDLQDEYQPVELGEEQAVDPPDGPTGHHATGSTLRPLSSVQMPPLPHNMSEHMKAMALSWYYAGYYAGVAEGYTKAWSEESPAG